MFTLLIPILACLAGSQAADAGKDFKEPVTVRFVIRDWNHTANNYGWRDWTSYESPELKDLEAIPAPIGDMVGSLLFKHANGPDANRVITWLKNKSDKNLRQCKVSLSEDPETPIITVELIPDSSKESVGEYTGFHLDCGDEIQSAAGGYPVSHSTSTGSVPVSSEVSMTPTAESASSAYTTNPPLKHPLLVTFMAAPDDLADPSHGGWLDVTDYGSITDSSPGILDDNDKKPPRLPENTESQVVLGQIKFYSQSATVRKYSWDPKGGNGDAPFKNCTLKLSDDPSVDEVWVWPAGTKIEAKKDGKGLSDQQVKDFEKMMTDKPVIINDCGDAK